MLIAFMAAMFQPASARQDNSPPGISQPVFMISTVSIPDLPCTQSEAYLLQTHCFHSDLNLMDQNKYPPGWKPDNVAIFTSSNEKSWRPPDIRWFTSMHRKSLATLNSVDIRPPGITKIRAVNHSYLNQRVMYVFRT